MSSDIEIGVSQHENDVALVATPVANIADLAPVGMKMVRVGDRRLVLIQTADGVFALDNACPHQGYGLVQGDLRDNLLTCEWHNWKFDVTTGSCVLGEEDVQSHEVTIDVHGDIFITLATQDPDVQRPVLMESLQRAITNNYIGQASRDTIRLLKASANPGELVWQAVAYGAPRAEFGWGHSIAATADCLSMVDHYDGDQRALPIIQGISMIAESERGYPINALADPVNLPNDARSAFRSAVEDERLTEAQGLVRGAIHTGVDQAELQRWFADVASDHLLAYGHGAIYTQKAFQLLDRLGWERADTVLGYLVPTIVYATREDKLPYMRKFMRLTSELNLSELAERPRDSTWTDGGALQAALLGHDVGTVVGEIVRALNEGAGIPGLLNTVSLAVSVRHLRYDVLTEFDLHDDFGWLDLTHGLTYANAARWMTAAVGANESTMRLALYTAFLAYWTGRHEWHTKIGPMNDVVRPSTEIDSYGAALQRRALHDPASMFIFQAHAIKMSVAATEEAHATRSLLPLDAASRFMESPKHERGVAATVAQSIDFLSGHTIRE